MRKHVQAAGAVMAIAALSLTGCGKTSKNAENAGALAVGDKPSASPSMHRSMSPSGSASPGSSVKIGAFCSDVGAVAQTSGGKAAQCTATSGGKSRWTATTSPMVTGNVKAGAYCTQRGAISQTAQGQAVTCTIKSGDTRARWTVGTVTIPGTVHGGAYCAPQGATAKGANGKTYTCSKTGNDPRARWHAS